MPSSASSHSLFATAAFRVLALEHSATLGPLSDEDLLECRSLTAAISDSLRSLDSSSSLRPIAPSLIARISSLSDAAATGAATGASGGAPRPPSISESSSAASPTPDPSASGPALSALRAAATQEAIAALQQLSALRAVSSRSLASFIRRLHAQLPRWDRLAADATSPDSILLADLISELRELAPVPAVAPQVTPVAGAAPAPPVPTPPSAPPQAPSTTPAPALPAASVPAPLGPGPMSVQPQLTVGQSLRPPVGPPPTLPAPWLLSPIPRFLLMGLRSQDTAHTILESLRAARLRPSEHSRVSPSILALRFSAWTPDLHAAYSAAAVSLFGRSRPFPLVIETPPVEGFPVALNVCGVWGHLAPQMVSTFSTAVSSFPWSGHDIVLSTPHYSWLRLNFHLTSEALLFSSAFLAQQASLARSTPWLANVQLFLDEELHLRRLSSPSDAIRRIAPLARTVDPPPDLLEFVTRHVPLVSFSRVLDSDGIPDSQLVFTCANVGAALAFTSDRSLRTSYSSGGGPIYISAPARDRASARPAAAHAPGRPPRSRSRERSPPRAPSPPAGTRRAVADPRRLLATLKSDRRSPHSLPNLTRGELQAGVDTATSGLPLGLVLLLHG